MGDDSGSTPFQFQIEEYIERATTRPRYDSDYFDIGSPLLHIDPLGTTGPILRYDPLAAIKHFLRFKQSLPETVYDSVDNGLDLLQREDQALEDEITALLLRMEILHQDGWPNHYEPSSESLLKLAKAKRRYVQEQI